MTETRSKQTQQRIQKEADALKKNLAKRKKQEQELKKASLKKQN